MNKADNNGHFAPVIAYVAPPLAAKTVELALIAATAVYSYYFNNPIGPEDKAEIAHLTHFHETQGMHPELARQRAIDEVADSKGAFSQIGSNNRLGRIGESIAGRGFESRVGTGPISQVSFYDPSTQMVARIDFVQLIEGTLYVEEAKTGGGKLSRNQEAVLAAILAGTAVPIGQKAKDAGLVVGEPVSASARDASVTTTTINSFTGEPDSITTNRGL